MRPDLRWIQDQLAGDGLDFDQCKDDAQGFACQCPVHKGGDKSARFAVRNGVLLFHCYAYGCDFRDVKDALDLTEAHCYADYILRDRERERSRNNPNHVTDAKALIVVAENDMQKRRLTDRELAQYRSALIRQHRGAA